MIDPALTPVLADALMVQGKATFGPIVPRKDSEPVLAQMRRARSFVFDRQASYRMGEIAAYDPDLIADAMEFARVPYPSTFVEWDPMAYLDALEDAGLAVNRQENKMLDTRVGFLFTDKWLRSAVLGADGLATWHPMIYRWHQPMTRAQEQQFCDAFECTRILIDQWFWGSVYTVLDPTRRRSMRAMHGIEIPEVYRSKPGVMRSLLEVGAGAGDFKAAILASLLLIRPNLTRVIHERKPGRKLHRGTPKRFMASTVVTINMKADTTRKRIIAAAKDEAHASKTRWHEVRGHYVHNHEARTNGCSHDWQQVEPNRWECGHEGCKGKRTWRTYPEGKGSAQIGYVSKHYVMKG